MPWIKHHLVVLNISEGDPVWNVAMNPEYSDLVEYVLRLYLADRLGCLPAKVIENEMASSALRTRVITAALGILEDKNCFADRALHYVYLFPHETSKASISTITLPERERFDPHLQAKMRSSHLVLSFGLR